MPDIWFWRMAILKIWPLSRQQIKALCMNILWHWAFSEATQLEQIDTMITSCDTSYNGLRASIFFQIFVLSEWGADSYRPSQSSVKKCKNEFQRYLRREQRKFIFSVENRLRKRCLVPLSDPKVWLSNPFVHSTCQTFPSILQNLKHVEFCEPITDFPSNQWPFKRCQVTSLSCCSLSLSDCNKQLLSQTRQDSMNVDLLL
jgi:hypothetical protein